MKTRGFAHAHLVCAVWLSLLVVGSATVQAATPAEKNEARARVATGKRHYNLGEFEAALKDYTEAYRHTDDPVLLFNIGQCQWKLGDNKNALHSYRSYLRNVPEPANREQAEARIAELEKKISATERTAADKEAANKALEQAAAEHAAAEKAAQQAAAARTASEKMAAAAERLEHEKAASEKAAAAAEKAASAAEKTAIAAEKTADAVRLQPRAAPVPQPGPVPVVVPEAKTGASLDRSPVDAPSPIYARWWFWTTTIGIVAGAAAAVLLLRSPDSNIPPCPVGTKCG